MAKSVDESKLERIKEATIEMVVSKGYGGASVSSIAKQAMVADGYLYRHYPSKQALVQALYVDTIDGFRKLIYELVQQYEHVEEVLFQIISSVFQLTNESPSKAKFLNMLMNDYTFLMSEEMLISIPKTYDLILKKGIHEGVFRPEITMEEFNAVFPSIPIQYASSRVKGVFSQQPLSEHDVRLVTQLCVKALAK